MGKLRPGRRYPATQKVLDTFSNYQSTVFRSRLDATSGSWGRQANAELTCQIPNYMEVSRSIPSYERGTQEAGHVRVE